MRNRTKYKTFCGRCKIDRNHKIHTYSKKRGIRLQCLNCFITHKITKEQMKELEII